MDCTVEITPYLRSILQRGPFKRRYPQVEVLTCSVDRTGHRVVIPGDGQGVPVCELKRKVRSPPVRNVPNRCLYRVLRLDRVYCQRGEDEQVTDQ